MENETKLKLQLLGMKLHAQIEIGKISILRVPGGWIYSIPTGDWYMDLETKQEIEIQSHVFVPEPK